MLLLTDGREHELFDSVEIFDNISNYWREIIWFKGIYNIFYKIYLYLILGPLFYLYIHGPSFLGFGFWRGKKFAEICSELSGIKDTSFWELTQENQLKCKEIIYNQFYSIYILIIIITYFIFLYALVKTLIKIFLYLFNHLKKYLTKLYKK